MEMFFDILPSIIGLFLVGYGFYHISRVAREFFSVARSWAIAFFMFGLGVLWTYKLLSIAAPDWFAAGEVVVDAGFVVFTIYLSVVIVATRALYRQHSSIDSLAEWLKRHPVNLLTVWGVLGILSFVSFVAVVPSTEALLDDQGPLLLVFVYLLASASIAIGLPSIRKNALLPTTPAERLQRMSALSAAWILIPSTELALDMALEKGYGFAEPNPYSWVLVVFFAIIVRTVSAKPFTAIIINPEVEDARKSGFRTYDIPRGVYLVEDDRSDPALKLFSELVTLPLRPDAEILGTKESAADTLEFLIPRGLAVTRDFPEGLRKTYNIHVTPIIWLTESAGELRIAPTSLAVLTDTIIRFMENNPNSIVLLEGVEYLITFNDFKKVLKSLDSLNETTWISKSRLLIALNPKAFDEKEVALLERHRTPLKGDAGIDSLKKNSTVRPARPA